MVLSVSVSWSCILLILTGIFLVGGRRRQAGCDYIHTFPTLAQGLIGDWRRAVRSLVR